MPPTPEAREQAEVIHETLQSVVRNDGVLIRWLVMVETLETDGTKSLGFLRGPNEQALPYWDGRGWCWEYIQDPKPFGGNGS